MRVAAVQCTAGQDRDDNLRRAGHLVDRAADVGAELVVLPELFSLLGPRDVMLAGAEDLEGPTVQWAADRARRHRCWLLAGTIAERVDDAQPGAGDRYYNTACLVGPDGNLAATYRKVHLFDNDVDGAAFRESASVAAGDEIVTTPLQTPTWSVRLGMATCYDLRFPELFRLLAIQGAQVVALPSAFTAVTGRAHWETLVRARAIENQSFVVAADQWGHTGASMECHGHSMIVGPWGEVMAEAPDGEGVIVADLTADTVAEVRTRLPSLHNRRPGVYRWPM
jgi:deaminated glutathione amidase